MGTRKKKKAAPKRTDPPPNTILWHRKRLALSRIALARLVGCSERAVYSWEIEGRTPVPLLRRAVKQALEADQVDWGVKCAA